MIRLTAYCLEWHITQSQAFYELLVEPLTPFVRIALTAWDGVSHAPLKHLERVVGEPVIFCQRPPSPDVLRKPDARLIWIPMWDNVVSLWSSQEWWNALPKTLRIVAFSDGVERKARMAGLPVLRLHYYKDPSNFQTASFKNGLILYYWNRVGLFGPQFIRKLCRMLDISEIFFCDSIDPKIARGAAYSLPLQIGSTTIHQISKFERRVDYFDMLKRCNVYLAPRSLEGVGMTFLEAMASGCAVMAYNAPTMNEYIDSEVDGFLFTNPVLEKEPVSLVHKVLNSITSGHNVRDQISYPRISLSQNWEQLVDLKLEMLGHTAREKQFVGFSKWQDMTSEYADFILDW